MCYSVLIPLMAARYSSIEAPFAHFSTRLFSLFISIIGQYVSFLCPSRTLSLSKCPFATPPPSDQVPTRNRSEYPPKRACHRPFSPQQDHFPNKMRLLSPHSILTYHLYKSHSAQPPPQPPKPHLPESLLKYSRLHSYSSPSERPQRHTKLEVDLKNSRTVTNPH